MATPVPTVTDHDDFQRQLLELRKREKAHTREGDAIVPFGDVFEGRDELVVYSHMFYEGEPWERQGCST
jgi:predicted dithiol-disulfide oxidoreductase (DUF899 family)